LDCNISIPLKEPIPNILLLKIKDDENKIVFSWESLTGFRRLLGLLRDTLLPMRCPYSRCPVG